MVDTRSETFWTETPVSHGIRTQVSSMTCMLHRPERYHVHHRGGDTYSVYLFILYTSEMFELIENRLYAYADYSTILVIVRKSADRPAAAASLNRDLTRIHE